MAIKAVIDFKKLQRDLEKASGVEAKKVIDSLKRSDLDDIGDAVIDEMKSAIAKGISPIKDAGRFPAYKWAAKKSLARKSGSKKKQADREFKGKYPYSAQKKFPGKRERPVNLKLSGEFLNNLKTTIKNKTILLGFFKKPFDDYELGHREGANDQPKRPIIPISGEEFTNSIYRRLVKAVQKVFDKKK